MSIYSYKLSVYSYKMCVLCYKLSVYSYRDLSTRQSYRTACCSPQ